MKLYLTTKQAVIHERSSTLNPQEKVSKLQTGPLFWGLGHNRLPVVPIENIFWGFNLEYLLLLAGNEFEKIKQGFTYSSNFIYRGANKFNDAWWRKVWK